LLAQKGNTKVELCERVVRLDFQGGFELPLRVSESLLVHVCDANTIQARSLGAIRFGSSDARHSGRKLACFGGEYTAQRQCNSKQN